MKATKIKMKSGCSNSKDLCEIDSIYLEEMGRFIKKEDIHDHLVKYPETIYVNISPYPFLQPAISTRGEKYVRSAPNSTPDDNLLKLPRCQVEIYVLACVRNYSMIEIYKVHKNI